MSDAYQNDTFTPDEIERANSELPPDELFGRRPTSSLDQLVERLPGIAAQNAGALKDKITADETVRARTEGNIGEDRARMVQSWDAMGVEADKLKPWDAEAAREKFKTDPLESFGSIGSVFAMIASAFTHAPMTNALNASAAAMHAIKDGNDEQFKRAFDAFKENNDLVVKRHAMMATQYNAAATLMDKDIAAGRDALQWNAARYGDQRLLTLLNNGFDKEALEYVSSFGKMTKDQEELREHLTENAYKQQSFQTGLAEIKKQYGNDPNQMAARTLAWYRHTFDKKEAKPADAAFGFWLSTEGLTKSPDEIMAKAHEFDRRARASVDLYVAETAQALEEQNIQAGMPRGDAKRKALEDATRAGSKLSAARGAGERTNLAEQSIAELEEAIGPVPSGVQVMLRQAYEAKGSNAALHTAQVEAAVDELKAMKEAGEIVTPAKISEVMNKAFATQPSLTPEMVEVGARLLLVGNPAWIQGLGNNRSQGAANQTAIKNRASEILVKEQGLDATQAAQLINRNTAGLVALKRGASQLGLRMAQVSGATNTALSTADRVVEASEKIDRTRFPTLNNLILSTQRGAGGKDAVDYRIALMTLITEYARAMGGGNSGLTVSMHQHAEKLIDEGYSKGQIRTAVEQLKKELSDMGRGADASLNEWGKGTELFGGTKPPAAAPPAQTGEKKRVQVAPGIWVLE